MCRMCIFDAHVNVMYHKQICRLQPTTSYHTVLGFPILARVTAHNFCFQIWFHPRDFLCMFISNGLTSPKWLPAWPTPRLKLWAFICHLTHIWTCICPLCMFWGESLLKKKLDVLTLHTPYSGALVSGDAPLVDPRLWIILLKVFVILRNDIFIVDSIQFLKDTSLVHK